MQSDKVLHDLSSKAGAGRADLYSKTTFATTQSMVPSAPSDQTSRCMALRSTKASEGHTKPTSTCRHQYSRSPSSPLTKQYSRTRCNSVPCVNKNHVGHLGNLSSLADFQKAWCTYRRCGRVKLSTLLGQSPSLFDDRKISVVDKGLTDIDHLPRHFHHVKVHNL